MITQSHTFTDVPCDCPAWTHGVDQIASGQLPYQEASEAQRCAFNAAAADTFCTNLACNFAALHDGDTDPDPHDASGVARTVKHVAGINLYRYLNHKSVQVHFCPCNTPDFVEVLYDALVQIITQGNLWKADITSHGETVHIRRKGKLIKITLARLGERPKHMRVNF